MRLLILLLLLSCSPRVTQEIKYELYDGVDVSDTLCFDTYKGLLPSQGKPLFGLGEPFGDVPQVRLPEARVEVRRPVVGKMVKATIQVDTVYEREADTIFCVDTVYVEKGINFVHKVGCVMVGCIIGAFVILGVFVLYLKK